jgi:hypothetical protein
VLNSGWTAGWFKESLRVFLQNRQAMPRQAMLGQSARVVGLHAHVLGYACSRSWAKSGHFGRSFVFPFSVFYYFYKSADVCYFYN